MPFDKLKIPIIFPDKKSSLFNYSGIKSFRIFSTLLKKQHKNSCTILCLRNEWIQVYINTAFPRPEDNNELSFWTVDQRGRKSEKKCLKKIQGKNFKNFQKFSNFQKS